MKQFNISKGIKGWRTLENAVLRFRYMIKAEALKRAKILTFWQEYGLQATIDAYGVKRSTLYLWKKNLVESKGKLESLNNKSRRPKTVRKRRIIDTVEEHIIQLRKDHPKLGKEKISKLLIDFCYKNNIEYEYSASTVGRILTNLKERRLLPKYIKLSIQGGTGNLIERKTTRKQKKLRIKHSQSKKHHNLVQVDTIIYFINGIKRYIVTAINPRTDFAFALAYKSHSSANTRDFFIKLQEVSPFHITHVQTDNGSEFDKYFGEYMIKQKIVHYHNYPRCPKMNCFVERFNRSLKEEFANYNKNTLAYDLDLFNRKMIDYLLWYNCYRPHHSLNLESPLQFIINSLTTEKSNMLWTSTNP
jgi:transposase InsO family protein